MSTKKYIGILIGVLCPLFGSLLGQSAQPNFILILADDQGWDGTSVLMDDDNPLSKSDFYQTPYLEQLASGGMKFSQAYAASPVCSPSRYAILTGMSPARLGMTDIVKRNPLENVNLACPDSEDEIDPTLTTIPEALKSMEDANYYCASYGKWHMGEVDPSEAGFDLSDGPEGNGPGNDGETLNDDPKRIFSITESGMNFVEDAVDSGRPFFLQLNHYAVHLWPKATEETYASIGSNSDGHHQYKIYGAMTQDLDRSVGIVLNQLEDLGIADNTYIIYTSDNGSVDYTNDLRISPNALLQKGKTHVWEGGIRVPMIVSGPGIMAGVQSDVNFTGNDIFATVLDLAGYSGEAANNTDAKSLKQHLLHNESVEENFQVFHFPHYANGKKGIPQSSIIMGDYKFLIDFWTGESHLFNIALDPGESNDLGALEPALKLSLYKQLRDYLKSVDASLPAFNPSYVRYGGVAPDVDMDGLNDTWEFEEVLTGAFNGDDDLDGDGRSNLQEHLDGTDPLDETDFALNSEPELELLQTNLQQNQDGLRIDLKKDTQLILIADVSGKIVYRADVNGHRTVSVSFRQDFNALYFLIVQSKNGTETIRFIR